MAPVLIVGGGIGGLAAAVALHRAGIPAEVFEQAPALQEVGAGVSLWPNAVRALDALELSTPVGAGHLGLERIVIRRRDGTPLLTLREPGRHSEPGICVHRAALQRTLASDVPGDRLHLGRGVVRFDADDAGVTVTLEDGDTARGALLIGCDGIRSTVRARLHGDTPARYRGYEIWRGVSDYDLPAPLLRQATEWWAPGQRFGILPGQPGRVYWYATHTTRRQPADDPAGAARLRSLFGGWPAPVPAIMAAAGAGAAVRTDAEDRPVPRRWGAGPVTLLGDAAHPMTPNMGQGACAAIEDAVVLARCMEGDGVAAAALRRYERLRAPRTRWTVRQSRRIGRLAQLTNPALVAGRDALIRLVPDGLADLPQKRVYGYR